MAALFHRVLLVLCVDAFRCLQLSPCRGSRRVRSSKRHGMKWRCLEARRKVQYCKSALICLCISKLCLPFYVCTVWRRDGKEDLNYRHVYLIDRDLSSVSQDIADQLSPPPCTWWVVWGGTWSQINSWWGPQLSRLHWLITRCWNYVSQLCWKR